MFDSINFALSSVDVLTSVYGIMMVLGLGPLLKTQETGLEAWFCPGLVWVALALLICLNDASLVVP